VSEAANDDAIIEKLRDATDIARGALQASPKT